MKLPEEAIFSVSEFLDVTNELLAAADFRVQGEVVGAKLLPSGFYFSVKDPAAVAIMDCYMSPYSYRSAGIVLEDGMLVTVGGIGSVYKPKGRFSFRVETIALAGEGSLKKAYEALKKKLTDEGLFDRKRPLPEFVRRIGLITSRSGAVIDDFRKNLMPLGMRIQHYDVRVEGATAARSIRTALEWFNAHAGTIDVLVVIRGGGSLEDLQAFNDEFVVRGVFGSRVPTMVAIGHDRDVPLAQLAADVSASTPTAMAHAVNATWNRLNNLSEVAQRIVYSYKTALSAATANVRAGADRLAVHVARLSGRGNQLAAGLDRGIERIGAALQQAQDQVTSAARHLEASSPDRLLRLGYSIVTDASGAVVRRVKQLQRGTTVRTRLASGAFTSEVKTVESN